MTGKLTLVGLNNRVVDLDRRLLLVEAEQHKLSNDHIAFSLADAALERADHSTAQAVDALTRAINDPERGLIVRLASFQQEVRSERKVFKAYIAGGVAVLSLVWTVALAFAPLIRAMLGLPQG